MRPAYGMRPTSGMRLTSGVRSSSGARPSSREGMRLRPQASGIRLGAGLGSSSRSRPSASVGHRGSGAGPVSGSRTSAASRLRESGASSPTLRGRSLAGLSVPDQGRERLSPAPSRRAARGRSPVPYVLLGIVVLGVVAAIVVGVLSGLPVFVITGIDAQDSAHLSADTVAKLANVEEGTTLLNVDVDQVQQNVERNPWVKSVTVRREFPDRLAVTVEERTVWAVVLIGSGTTAWALGDDGVWIEPVQLDTSSSSDVTAAALAKASELGCLLITNVPSSVDPAQGSESTDAPVQAVLTYQQQLPPEITSQAQVYYAASEGSVSVVLQSGLEISLGTPSDVAAKAQALTELMNTYPDQLTYVNVRVPSKPTYRRISEGVKLSGAADVVASKGAEASTTAETSAAQTDAGST